ncbi:hypothetical protein [Thermosynechococcus sp.]|uniref:hypothetical protein n=1 Tax=Thermosynechococcus sp. TaxID=2814275 RepID=UPI00263965A7|nr:hypothetical protein [Thermosynechococcus sp.]
MASQWAVHQCLYGDRLCGVLRNHLLGVVPATLGVLAVVMVAWRRPALTPPLRQLSFSLLPLVALQVALGWSTLQLKLQVPVTHRCPSNDWRHSSWGGWWPFQPWRGAIAPPFSETRHLKHL